MRDAQSTSRTQAELASRKIRQSGSTPCISADPAGVRFRRITCQGRHAQLVMASWRPPGAEGRVRVKNEGIYA